MDIKSIKQLAEKYSSLELQKMAEEFEVTGNAPVTTQSDPGDQLSDYLQACEVKQLMEKNSWDLQQALREFSKRVRNVLK